VQTGHSRNTPSAVVTSSLTLLAVRFRVCGCTTSSFRLPERLRFVYQTAVQGIQILRTALLILGVAFETRARSPYPLAANMRKRGTRSTNAPPLPWKYRMSGCPFLGGRCQATTSRRHPS
jgi:hypothetical protein